MQSMYVSRVAGRPMDALNQQLQETISYRADYSAWLAAGESLSSVTISVSPSALTPPTILNKLIVDNARAVQFQIFSDCAEGQYEIKLSALTSGGQTKVDTFLLWAGDGIPRLPLIQIDQATTPTIALYQLTDVSVVDGLGIDGYTLTWSQSAGKWIARPPVEPPSAGPSMLRQLSDVSVADGQWEDQFALVWDYPSRKWVARPGLSPMAYVPANVAANLADLVDVAAARTHLGLAPVAASGSASDLGTGTLPAARLPNPSPTTLGGVKSLAAVSHQFLTQIGTDGLPAAAQPAFTDISGSVSATQMPALTGDVTTSAGAVATTIANGAVTSAKLASGAAVSNIGYTPANKAGDTFSGDVAINAGYLNFGATLSVNGYGFRDNSGIVEVKNSGGHWTPAKDYWLKLTSGRTLTNNTSAQAIFAGGGGPTNGAITLPVGVYFFELHIKVTGLSGSSNSLSFLLAGTAAISGTLYAASANKGSATIAPGDVATAVVVTPADTTQTAYVRIAGSFTVTSAGTVIPQIQQNTNSAAASVNAGANFRCKQVSTDSTTAYMGPWS